MNPSDKHRERENTLSIYEELAKQRSIEFQDAHFGAVRLHKTDVDTVDYLHSNPNDRIQWAAESGIFEDGQ